MKKILMLGGSNCQKNAIIQGKALGHEMIIVDYSKNPLACESSDKHIMVSTFDETGCMKAAEEYKVDGIMTTGTDQPVLTAAIVAEALNLPTLLSPSQAKAVTNKKIMKQIFKEHNIPTVKYQLLAEDASIEDIKDLSAPYVLKPLDSQGQRGVYKLESKKLVLENIPKTLSYSREKEALLEEYYSSDEITVSGWVQDSKLHILTVTDRLLRSDPVHIGICVSHRFPSVHMDEYEKIKKISEDIVVAFGLSNGPLYIQMLVGDQGIMVNEIAARVGGAFEDVIIPKISGFNILEAVIQSCLGLHVDTTVLNGFDCSQSKVSASVQLMFAKTGIISYITPLEELYNLDHVLDAGYNYTLGDRINNIENATARFGHCVLLDEVASIIPAVKKFKETFKVLDQEGKNLYAEFENQ